MLLAFRVKNFLSFREEAILDLRPNDKIKSREAHILHDKFEALKTIPIYGANASGKSNIILAMSYMREFILFSIFGPPYENTIAKIIPFRFDCNQEPTELEIMFCYEGRHYLYGFSVYQDKIVTEWLDVDGENIFSREQNKILSTNVSLVSAGYNTDYLFLAALWRIMSIEDRVALIGNMELFFRRSFICLNPNTIGAFSPSTAVYSDRLHDDQNFQNIVVSFLKLADPTIDSINFYEDRAYNKVSNSYEFRRRIRLMHQTYSAQGDILGTQPLPLSCESTGTVQLLLFIQLIIDFVECGGVLVIDELSAHLHPLLVEYVLNYLQGESNTKAQLIYSTHSAEIMTDQFRDDECYLVDKDGKGRSSLYSLAAFNNLSVDRSVAYLQGRFGGVPRLTPSFLSKGGIT